MLVHVRMKIDLFVIVLNNLSLAQASQKYVITPKFILSWIQKYRRPTNEVPPKLIATYGNNFKFLGKEETTEQLLNGTLNKNAGPGYWENLGIRRKFEYVEKMCRKDDDVDLKELVYNAVLIDATYGNGCAASATDSNIGGETSFS
ncbi:13736_t:CDS:2 [Entrophospora sp. SA101]|nr:13736_t:CDS:2 [Entrophospora sp. SA101]